MSLLLAILFGVVSYVFARFITRSFFDGLSHDESKYPSAWKRIYRCSCGVDWSDDEWTYMQVCPMCGADSLKMQKKISSRTVIKDGKLALEERET